MLSVEFDLGRGIICLYWRDGAQSAHLYFVLYELGIMALNLGSDHVGTTRIPVVALN